MMIISFVWYGKLLPEMVYMGHKVSSFGNNSSLPLSYIYIFAEEFNSIFI